MSYVDGKQRKKECWILRESPGGRESTVQVAGPPTAV